MSKHTQDPAASTTGSILDVEGLDVTFSTDGGDVHAVIYNHLGLRICICNRQRDFFRKFKQMACINRLGADLNYAGATLRGTAGGGNDIGITATAGDHITA